MIPQTLAVAASEAYRKGHRLVAPLMGFPGITITGGSIKLAQQNYGEHYRAIKALVGRFRPDMIFPLMDLSVEANALGRYTMFPKHDSATVPKDAFEEGELDRLADVNIAFDMRLLGYVQVLKLMSIGLPTDVVRGAYVAGPYSLAALIIGADNAALATLLEPAMLHRLCTFTTDHILQYIRLLISAGAQTICLLESSAVMLGPDQFEEFSARYVRKIAKSSRYNGANTIYHTCGNTMHLVGHMAGAGVNGISLDAASAGVDLSKAAALTPADVAIIGNICPTGALLTGTPADVEREVVVLLDAMRQYPNFILSTGCDLPQETPLENIEAFMRAGRSYRV